MSELHEVLWISPEVQEAIERRVAVALETSIVAQGLPPPHNLEAARRCSAAVRAAGAVPAAIALIDGKLVVGVTDEQMQRLADPSRKAAKAGVRDLGALLAAKRDAGTTVSATCLAASLARIRLFATGGIGGVHRRNNFDEAPDISSDLIELSRNPVCVVSAGPKVILDLPATSEFLETVGVPVIGYKTSELPAFYSAGSGIPLEHRVDSPLEAAHALRFHWALRRRCGVLLAVAPPLPIAREEIEAALGPVLAEAYAKSISGKESTPFLLAALAKVTGGKTLSANLALVENNARVAAEVAVALASI